jgi:type II secretion system protein J
MSRNGFTLLEILLSLTLLAIILATIYQAFFGHVKTMEATRLIEEHYQIGRTALDIMAREIEGAYLGSEEHTYIFLGIDGQSVEGVPTDTLHFVTTSSFTGSDRLQESGLREITYRFTVDQETEEGLIVRREDQTVDEDLQTGGREQILAERIKGLDLLFIDEEGKEVEAWDSAESKQLPVAVKITIFIDEEGTEGLSMSAWTSIPLSLGKSKQVHK